MRSRKNASYTIEAAVIMPLYACAMVAVLLFFRIFSVLWTMEVNLHEVAEEAAYSGKELDVLPLAAAVEAKVATSDAVRTYVDGGLLGFGWSASEVTNTDVHLVVQYRLTVPIGLLGPIHFDVTQEAKHRRWVGYDPYEGCIVGEEYVYVAKYGEDYHNSLHCPYLRPAIHVVAGRDVDDARNADGKRYRACSYCHPKKQGTLYVTDYGETYHSKRDCSALKRTISYVPLSEVSHLRACRKCYGNKNRKD